MQKSLAALSENARPRSPGFTTEGSFAALLSNLQAVSAQRTAVNYFSFHSLYTLARQPEMIYIMLQANRRIQIMPLDLYTCMKANT